MEKISGPKLILVPFAGSEEDGPALEYALNLAKLYNARVEAWHISVDPASVVPYALADISVYPMFVDIDKANKEIKEAAHAAYLDALRKAGVKNSEDSERAELPSAGFYTAMGRAKDLLAVKARMADLVVMSRSEENTGIANIANGVLFGSARPVILIPPGNKPGSKNKVLIAWNGSRESARAVADAMPYLRDKEVMILTSQESKQAPLKAEDLKRYFAQHGIDASILTHMDGGAPLGSAILNTARLLDVGMIVMGGWSHSRAYEYILGGVTDYMLHNADVPVLMAH